MEWVVTMQNPQGLRFMDYFEGNSEYEVKRAAERYYTDSVFLFAECIDQNSN